LTAGKKTQSYLLRTSLLVMVAELRRTERENKDV